MNAGDGTAADHDRLVGVGDLEDLVAVELQELGEDLPHLLVILHEQDRLRATGGFPSAGGKTLPVRHSLRLRKKDAKN